jgi:hypothetical protein
MSSDRLEVSYHNLRNSDRGSLVADSKGGEHGATARGHGAGARREARRRLAVDRRVRSAACRHSDREL